LIDKSGEVGSKSAEEKCGEVAFWGNCVIARDKLAIRTSGSQKRRYPVHLRQTGMSSLPDGFHFERAITSIAIIGAGL